MQHTALLSVLFGLGLLIFYNTIPKEYANKNGKKGRQIRNNNLFTKAENERGGRGLEMSFFSQHG